MSARKSTRSRTATRGRALGVLAIAALATTASGDVLNFSRPIGGGSFNAQANFQMASQFSTSTTSPWTANVDLSDMSDPNGHNATASLHASSGLNSPTEYLYSATGDAHALGIPPQTGTAACRFSDTANFTVAPPTPVRLFGSWNFASPELKTVQLSQEPTGGGTPTFPFMTATAGSINSYHTFVPGNTYTLRCVSAAHAGGFIVQTGFSSALTLRAAALPGDANIDNTVDTIDFNLLAASFGLTGKTWFDGDFDFNGTVDTIDFNLLAANFSHTFPGPAGSVVPEPALSLCALIFTGLPLIARRRGRA